MTRLFRKGDVVNLIATVAADQRVSAGNEAEQPMVQLQIEGTYAALFVEAARLQLIVPRFNPDDKVVSTEFVGTGIVRSVFGEHAWVELGGKMRTCLAGDLRLESEVEG